MHLKQSIAGINHKYWGFMLIFVSKTQHFPLTLHSAPMQKFWFLGNYGPKLIQTKCKLSEI